MIMQKKQEKFGRNCPLTICAILTIRNEYMLSCLYSFNYNCQWAHCYTWTKAQKSSHRSCTEQWLW